MGLLAGQLPGLFQLPAPAGDACGQLLLLLEQFPMAPGAQLLLVLAVQPLPPPPGFLEPLFQPGLEGLQGSEALFGSGQLLATSDPLLCPLPHPCHTPLDLSPALPAARQLPPFPLLLPLEGPPGLQPFARLPSVLQQALPGPLGLMPRLALPEPLHHAHPLAARPPLPLPASQSAGQLLPLLLDFPQSTGGPAGGRQQLAAPPGDLLQQSVAAAAGHLAQAAAQHRLEPVPGVHHWLANVVTVALLGPQQAGNTLVFGAAGAPARQRIAQQPGQLFLRLVAGVALAVHPQITAGLAQKALGQLPASPRGLEVNGDLRGRSAVCPGQQVANGGGAVALEKGGAQCPHQGALAALVGAGKELDALAEIIQDHRLVEAAQLGHLNAANSHDAASCPASSSARISRASRATSPPSSPAWACCSSLSTWRT